MVRKTAHDNCQRQSPSSAANVTVRPIRPAEIDWLWTLDWNPLPRERDTFYVLALAMQGRWAWLAEIDREPAGVLLASASDAQSQVYLNHLLVLAPARGRGVGTALMDRLETEAAAAGIRRIILFTGDARGFYERRGYAVTTRALPAPIQSFVERVKSALVMAKDL